MKRIGWMLALAALVPSLALAQSRPPAQRTGPLTIFGTGSTGDLSTTTVVPNESAANNTLAKLMAERITTKDAVTKTNPSIPGSGISFGNIDSDIARNGSIYNFIVDGNAARPTNGFLVNGIVKPGYYQKWPTFVAANYQLQIQDANAAGNDWWALLGILDIQQPSGSAVGGQATSGIIRGNWNGLNLTAGVRAQAENYSGTPAYGFIASASQTDGTGKFFNNAWDTGVFVHMAKNYGVLVGGPQGPVAPTLPAAPFAFHGPNGAPIWTIQNINNAAVQEYITGGITITPYGGGLAMVSTNYSLDSVGNIKASTISETFSSTPSSSSAACTTGQHYWDANYEYRCVATNTWKRAALSTW